MKVLVFSKGELLTNTYFCIDEETNEAIIIDPGMRPDLIYDKIRERELKVKLILLTHGHFDHALGAKYLKEQTGAPIAIHRNDAPLLCDSRKNSADMYFGYGYVYPDTTADILMEDGDILKLGDTEFKVMLTPGHTEGSCIFLTQDTIFSGDTLFALSYGRTDLYGGNFLKLEETMAALKRIPGTYKLCPGHGNSRRDITLDALTEEVFFRSLR